MTETNPSPLMVAIDLATLVIERRNTIPILDNVLLTAGRGGSTLLVEATDLDVEITVEVPLESASDFLVSANGKAIQAAVAHFGGVTTFFAEDQTRLVVGDTFTFSCLDPNDYRRLRIEVEEEKLLELDAGELLDDLRALAPAMSNEETRYYLNGIFFHQLGAGDDTRLRMAATDGHRLVTVTRPLRVGSIPEAIVPKKVIHVLIHAIELTGVKTVKLSLSRECGVFVVGDLTIRAKMIDGKFPDYTRVILQGDKGSLVADSDVLRDAAAGAKVIHGTGDKTRSLIFSFEDRTFVASSVETGRMVLPMLGLVEGEPPSQIGVNACYLETMVDAFGEGPIKLGFGDAASPILLSAEGSPVMSVLMPMRI